MSRLSFIAFLCLTFGLSSIITPTAATAETINGAGASFPYPIYSKWAFTYGKKNAGVNINYQSMGSGAGVKQIMAKTVDFGATDAPMKAEQLEAFNLVQFPMVIGGVVPVVNIAGVEKGELKLDAETLAKIFMGDIDKWNDPAITALNEGLNLPEKAITVVHRSDSSGTSFIFTNYLTKKVPAWAERVGEGKKVAWPVGVGGKGNEGVSSYVQQVDGSIGYVEFAFVKQGDLSYTQLQNSAGKFVKPEIATFQAAASSADWSSAPGYYVILTDQPGETSWPITGATFILVQEEQEDAAKAKAMLEFFHWAYTDGAEMAVKDSYVPMPENVIALVEKTWNSDIKADGGAVWTMEKE